MRVLVKSALNPRGRERKFIAWNCAEAWHRMLRPSDGQTAELPPFLTQYDFSAGDHRKIGEPFFGNFVEV